MKGKLYDTIEETDGYQGLHGEVATEDIYRLRKLDFVPDVIIDLGGNIGVFAIHARSLFPDALIVSVEPNPTNAEHYRRFVKPDGVKTTLIEAAIARGAVYRSTTAANRAGECYISGGLGYPSSGLANAENMEAVNVETVTLSQIVGLYADHGKKKFALKIDIEGNEHTIFTSPTQMEFLRLADYICMEVHFYALNSGLTNEVNEKTMAALNSLKDTHAIELDNVNFWATKHKYHA